MWYHYIIIPQSFNTGIKNVMASSKPAEGKRNIQLRMWEEDITELDDLCEINGRSRVQIIEILVRDAYAKHVKDSTSRVTP